MSKIYRYDWIGEQTGWDYRVDVIPASTAPLSSIEYIPIPKGAFEIKGRELGYNKYPLGAFKSQMSVFWDISLIPDDEVYAELLDALLSPNVEMTRPLCSDSNFTTGTFYRYYINGGSVLFGIQETGIEEGYSLKNKTLETLVVSALFFSLKNVLFDKLADMLSDNTHIARLGCIEAMKWDGSIAYHLAHYLGATESLPSRYIWFRKLQDIFDYIIAAASQIYSKITRISSTVSITNSNWPAYYKNERYGDGSLGSQVSFSNLYIIAAIAESAAYSAGMSFSEGLFIPGSEYVGDGGKNAWDYLSDLTKNELLKMNFNSANLILYPMFTAGTVIDMNIDDFNDVRLKYDTDAVNNVVSSMSEVISGDMSRYEVNSGQGRDSGGFTIPVKTSNHPVSETYKYKYDADFGSTNTEESNYIYNVPRLTNLYYQSLYFSPIQFMRVHEFVRFKLSSTVNSDDLDGCNFEAFPLETTMIRQHSEELCLDMQANTCKPRMLAKVFYALYGGKKPMMIEIEGDYEVMQLFANGGGFSYIFNLGVTAYDPHVKNAPTRYALVSSRLDDINEKAVITLTPEMF